MNNISLQQDTEKPPEEEEFLKSAYGLVSTGESLQDLFQRYNQPRFLGNLASQSLGQNGEKVSGSVYLRASKAYDLTYFYADIYLSKDFKLPIDFSIDSLSDKLKNWAVNLEINQSDRGLNISLETVPILTLVEGAGPDFLDVKVPLTYDQFKERVQSLLEGIERILASLREFSHIVLLPEINLEGNVNPTLYPYFSKYDNRSQKQMLTRLQKETATAFFDIEYYKNYWFFRKSVAAGGVGESIIAPLEQKDYQPLRVEEEVLNHELEYYKVHINVPDNVKFTLVQKLLSTRDLVAYSDIWKVLAIEQTFDNGSSATFVFYVTRYKKDSPGDIENRVEKLLKLLDAHLRGIEISHLRIPLPRFSKPYAIDNNMLSYTLGDASYKYFLLRTRGKLITSLIFDDLDNFASRTSENPTRILEVFENIIEALENYPGGEINSAEIVFLPRTLYLVLMYMIRGNTLIFESVTNQNILVTLLARLLRVFNMNREFIDRSVMMEEDLITLLELITRFHTQLGISEQMAVLFEQRKTHLRKQK